MISIIDYGMGNLRSVQKALEKVGAEAHVTDDPQDIARADGVVLPGVGAVNAAMARLIERGLVDPIKEFIETRRPFLGICLGLQLLFQTSEEGGGCPALGILEGESKLFREPGLKVPHMGWNQLNMTPHDDCPIFRGIPDGSNVYFCHSYFVAPSDSSIAAATTRYGHDFCSAVRRDNVIALQFHPEKSQDVGLTILNNFRKFVS